MPPFADRRIRPLAIAIFSRGGEILVAEGLDPVKGETFYRPLGGAIEFGEPAHAALRRELREETGLEISALAYLGALENIFTYADEPGHEIVLVFRGELADRAVYEREEFEGREDGDVPFRFLWKRVEDFRTGRARLYPEGLLDLLDAQAPASTIS